MASRRVEEALLVPRALEVEEVGELEQEPGVLIGRRKAPRSEFGGRWAAPTWEPKHSAVARLCRLRFSNEPDTTSNSEWHEWR